MGEQWRIGTGDVGPQTGSDQGGGQTRDLRVWWLWSGGSNSRRPAKPLDVQVTSAKTCSPTVVRIFNRESVSKSDISLLKTILWLKMCMICAHSCATPTIRLSYFLPPPIIVRPESMDDNVVLGRQSSISDPLLTRPRLETHSSPSPSNKEKRQKNQQDQQTQHRHWTHEYSAAVANIHLGSRLVIGWRFNTPGAPTQHAQFGFATRNIKVGLNSLFVT